MIQRSIPTITVRGVSADNFRGSDESATDTSLEWEEEGRVVTATGGMKLDDAITLLNGLRWRPDGLDGFDPASSVIPLITEQSSINAPAGHALVLYITSQNGPITIGSTTSPTDAVNVPGEAAVIVGDTSPVIGALMPELVATGTRQPDGSVATVGGSMLVEPDDTVIRFNGDQALRPTVLNSLEPTTVAKLGEVASLSNTRQLQLPVVAATTPGPTQLLLRGGTTDDPVSLCLRTDNDEQCRSSRAQRQMTKWTEVVRIGTRWFILGRQPATDPPPVAYRWQPNGADATLADVIQPDLTDVVGTDTLWYAELPPDLDAVGSGHITNQGVLVDLIGRPSGGIISTGWSRPPW